MVIDTAKLKVSTKTLVALFFGFGSAMQIPQVSQFVLSVTAQHKNLASLVTTISGIALLLHNPEVQDALGIKKTVQVTETSEQVSLAKDAQ
jgi:hypothetical protein